MSICPLYTLRENAKKMPWEEIVRFNCGTCANWNRDMERCREEEKLKESGGGRCGDPETELLQKNGKAAL